jgi:hypothetical protein
MPMRTSSSTNRTRQPANTVIAPSSPADAAAVLAITVERYAAFHDDGQRSKYSMALSVPIVKSRCLIPCLRGSRDNNGGIERDADFASEAVPTVLEFATLSADAATPN